MRDTLAPSRRPITMLGALALLTVGCQSPYAYPVRDVGPRGDASARGDAGPATPSEPTCAGEVDDGFCVAYAAALCAAQFACCDEPTTLPASMADCETEVREECMDLRRDTCGAAEVLRFDGDAESAVLARLESARTDCAAVPYAQIDHLATLRGSLAEGADCSPTGADWSRTYACAPGLYCHVSDMWDEEGVLRSECRRYAPVGAVCGVEAECDPSAHCVSADLESETGTCVANLGVEAACVTDDDCESEVCDADTSRCLAEDPHDTWCGEGSE